MVEQPWYFDQSDLHERQPDCIDVNAGIAANFDDLTQTKPIRVVFGILYSTLFFVGMIFNGGVVWAVYRHRKLRSSSNIFLVNLMIADLLLCLTAIPVTPVAVIRKEWIFGAFLCRFLPLSQSWSVLITSWSLTAIALDKYIHIWDATLSAVTQLHAFLITTVIVLISGLVNIPYVLSYGIIDGKTYVNSTNSSNLGYCGEFCEELNWSSDLDRRVYGTSIMSLQFVVPMVVITFCYTRILMIVKRDMIVDNSNFSASLTTQQRKDALRKKRKVNYILIGMVMAFIASWFPLTIVNILRDFGSLPLFVQTQPWLWTLIVHFTAMTTVIWNPLLFFYLTGAHRRSRTDVSGGGSSAAGTTQLQQNGNGSSNIMADTSSSNSYINGAYDWIKKKSVESKTFTIQRIRNKSSTDTLISDSFVGIGNGNCMIGGGTGRQQQTPIKSKQSSLSSTPTLIIRRSSGCERVLLLAQNDSSNQQQQCYSPLLTRDEQEAFESNRMKNRQINSSSYSDEASNSHEELKTAAVGDGDEDDLKTTTDEETEILIKASHDNNDIKAKQSPPLMLGNRQLHKYSLITENGDVNGGSSKNGGSIGGGGGHSTKIIHIPTINILNSEVTGNDFDNDTMFTNPKSPHRHRMIQCYVPSSDSSADDNTNPSKDETNGGLAYSRRQQQQSVRNYPFNGQQSSPMMIHPPILYVKFGKSTTC